MMYTLKKLFSDFVWNNENSIDTKGGSVGLSFYFLLFLLVLVFIAIIIFAILSVLFFLFAIFLFAIVLVSVFCLLFCYSYFFICSFSSILIEEARALFLSVY